MLKPQVSEIWMDVIITTILIFSQTNNEERHFNIPSKNAFFSFKQMRRRDGLMAEPGQHGRLGELHQVGHRTAVHENHTWTLIEEKKRGPVIDLVDGIRGG